MELISRASLGNIAFQALKNGALSGGINAGFYAGTSLASGHAITYAGLGAAFASGFVSGALGTKGILSPASGSTVTRWAVANIVTGEASYIAGQYAQKQAPTVTGMWENVPGALAGGLVSDFTKSEIRGVVFGSVAGGISYFVDAFTPVGIWNTQGPLF